MQLILKYVSINNYEHAQTKKITRFIRARELFSPEQYG